MSLSNVKNKLLGVDETEKLALYHAALSSMPRKIKANRKAAPNEWFLAPSLPLSVLTQARQSSTE